MFSNYRPTAEPAEHMKYGSVYRYAAHDYGINSQWGSTSRELPEDDTSFSGFMYNFFLHVFVFALPVLPMGGVKELTYLLLAAVVRVWSHR